MKGFPSTRAWHGTGSGPNIFGNGAFRLRPRRFWGPSTAAPACPMPEHGTALAPQFLGPVRRPRGRAMLYLQRTVNQQHSLVPPLKPVSTGCPTFVGFQLWFNVSKGYYAPSAWGFLLILHQLILYKILPVPDRWSELYGRNKLIYLQKHDFFVKTSADSECPTFVIRLQGMNLSDDFTAVAKLVTQKHNRALWSFPFPLF